MYSLVVSWMLVDIFCLQCPAPSMLTIRLCLSLRLDMPVLINCEVPYTWQSFFKRGKPFWHHLAMACYIVSKRGLVWLVEYVMNTKFSHAHFIVFKTSPSPSGSALGWFPWLLHHPPGFESLREPAEPESPWLRWRSAATFLCTDRAAAAVRATVYLRLSHWAAERSWWGLGAALLMEILYNT